MTVLIDQSAKPELLDKRAVMDKMQMATPPENHRLDGTEAMGHAYDIYVAKYDPRKHREEMTKPFLRCHAIELFMHTKNLKAMCWAFDWLRAEYDK